MSSAGNAAKVETPGRRPRVRPVLMRPRKAMARFPKTAQLAAKCTADFKARFEAAAAGERKSESDKLRELAEAFVESVEGRQ